MTTEAETSVMQRVVGHHWKLEKTREDSPDMIQRETHTALLTPVL